MRAKEEPLDLAQFTSTKADCPGISAKCRHVVRQR